MVPLAGRCGQRWGTATLTLRSSLRQETHLARRYSIGMSWRKFSHHFKIHRTYPTHRTKSVRRVGTGIALNGYMLARSASLQAMPECRLR